MIAAAAPRVFSRDVMRNVRPRERVRTRDWVTQYVFTKDGLPFDANAFPHSLGVYDAFDDDRYREYVMQWAARLGKTFIVQSITEKIAATNPRPMLFASASENVSSDVVQYTLLQMIRNCPVLRAELPKRTSKYSVNLRHCRVKVAWSGSHSRLADYSAWFLHANEIDKWTTDKSTEADPLLLATERCKEYPDRKMFFESTPGLRGHSRVEARLKRSTNCRYWVPCAFCGRFQVLKMANVVWDKPEGEEHSDPDYASQTARYRCEHCEKELLNHHRPLMMRSGLWVPEGCYAEDGKVCGVPVNPNTTAWGSQLSSLYALTLTWGDIAKNFLSSKKRANEFQNFVNSWLGETWEPHRSKSTPEMVAERLKCNVPRYMVAAGASFLTCGVDVQQDHLKYVIVAWGECERGWLVDYGAVDTWEDLQAVIDNHYAREDDGHSVGIRLTLIDSRYRQPEVRAFCREHHRPGRAIIPSMGQSTLGGLPFRLSTKTADGKKLVHSRMSIQVDLVEVNTNYYQDIIQQYLDDGRPGEEGGFAIFAEAADDMEFLCELLNEVQSGKVNTRGYTELLWVQKNESEPNDFRDALRYARCAADVFARGNWRRPQMPGKPAVRPVPSSDTTSQQSRKLTPFGKSNIVRKSGWLNRRE